MSTPGVPVSDSNENFDPFDPELDDFSDEIRKSRHGRQFFGWLRESSVIIITALTLSVLLRTFVFQAFYVPSVSMQNTLLINDRIIASKLSLHVSDLHRGDVIVFRDPGGWLPEPLPIAGVRGTINSVLTWVGILPANSGKDLVKRIIGVGGDHITCCDADGRLKVNGIAIDESAYIVNRTDQMRFDITVPICRVFVMGDNRGQSSDSRFHMDVQSGTVPLDNVVGQAVALVWPLNRFTTLRVPAALADLSNPN